MRVAGVDQRVAFYSLDVIISVGYRVKLQRGIYLFVIMRVVDITKEQVLKKGNIYN